MRKTDRSVKIENIRNVKYENEILAPVSITQGSVIKTIRSGRSVPLTAMTAVDADGAFY